MNPSTLGGGAVAAVAAALALGIALYTFRPAERRSARNGLLMLAAGVAAQLGAMLAGGLGTPLPATVLANGAGVLVGVALIRLAGLVLFRALLPALGWQVVRIAQDLVISGVLLAWALVWLRMVGVDPASLFTTSAVITAIVAFSMQDTLGNLLGGVVLQLDDSLQVGDWVRLDDTSGRVTDIRWRHTAIETRNGETVIVPNSWLMKNRFTVVGLRTPGAALRWRRVLTFPVSLEASPSEVCRVLARAVTEAEIPHVLADPPPSAVLLETAEGYGRYALRYWMDDPAEDDPTDSRVRTHALAALTRHRLALAVPREEHLLVKENEARQSALLAAEAARRRAALDGVELFSALSAAEKDTLASHLVYAPFAQGDVVTRQGDVAHWLYLILGGEADIWIDTPAGRSHLAALGAGTIFGEMGMLTGEPRHATVTARTDLTCYRLDKAGFEAILHGRPDIAAEMSELLTRRAQELDALRAQVNDGRASPPAHSDLLGRIREFFGLG